MTLTVAGRGEIHSPGNPSKEKKLWKIKYEVVICERTTLQEMVPKLYEELDRS